MSKEGLSETERLEDEELLRKSSKILHVHITKKSPAYMEMLRTQSSEPATDVRGQNFQRVTFQHNGTPFSTIGAPRLLDQRSHELVDGGDPQGYQAEELLVLPQ